MMSLFTRLEGKLYSEKRSKALCVATYHISAGQRSRLLISFTGFNDYCIRLFGRDNLRNELSRPAKFSVAQSVPSHAAHQSLQSTAVVEMTTFRNYHHHHKAILSLPPPCMQNIGPAVSKGKDESHVNAPNDMDFPG